MYPVYATVHMYTRQVTFSMVPEKHGYVYLVGLYEKEAIQFWWKMANRKSPPPIPFWVDIVFFSVFETIF